MPTYPFKHYICALTAEGHPLSFFVTTNQPLDTKDAFEALHRSIRATSEAASSAVVSHVHQVSPGYSAGDFEVLTVEQVA
jgi:hypothetical protein